MKDILGDFRTFMRYVFTAWRFAIALEMNILSREFIYIPNFFPKKLQGRVFHIFIQWLKFRCLVIASKNEAEILYVTYCLA